MADAEKASESISSQYTPPTEPNLLDWSGPDDPDNPHNWLFGKRAYHAGITAFYAFTTTLMSSMYASGTKEVAEHFHVSTTVSLLGVSIFCLGLSFGPVLAAPLSETFGRSIVYRISLPLGALFTIGSAVAENMATIVICRFFAGFLAAPALSVGGGTIADIYPPASRGVAVSMFLLAPFLGPAVGPIIGGFVIEKKSFRWLEWVMLFFMVATYLYSALLKETYKPIILQRSRKQLGLSQPLKSAGGPGALKTFLTVSLFRPILMLVTEPIVACFSLYVAVDFGILYIFFASFPLVYSRVYKFNSGQIGLTFLPLMVGCMLATITCLLCDKFLYQKQLQKIIAANNSDSNMDDEEITSRSSSQVLPRMKHQVEPEHRLYSAMIGSVGLPIGLFWFAWTARSNTHWANPVVATLVFSWGNLCVFVAAIMYLIDSYGPRYGASALSANGFSRYIFAAGFPLFAIQMYNRLGIAWATSLLGFVSTALLPIPWVLFIWGTQNSPEKFICNYGALMSRQSGLTTLQFGGEIKRHFSNANTGKAWG